MATFFFILLTFCWYAASVCCYTPSLLLNRRALHQPFFPLISQPPANPPSPLPKYPSSTTPLPFFPSFPSPPPPPSPPAAAATSSSPSLSDLPANISSLVFPVSGSSPSRSGAKKLVLCIALPILSLALLGLALVFFLRCRRHRSSGTSSRAESDRLYPANAAASDGGGGRKLSNSSGPASSEFLFLGTVVNSRGTGIGEGPAAAAPPSADPQPYRRLDSPELQPLPPLSRHVRRVERHPEPCSSEEEFYSPRVSSAGKENPSGATAAAVPASRHGVHAPLVEKCGSDSSTLSSSASSYPSSDPASSPTRSPSSPSSGSSPEESTAHAPPQPPRTAAHSPPKRKSPPPSPRSSPLQEITETTFVRNGTKGAPNEAAPDQENWMSDPKKSQNIAILLRALNLTMEEVCEALMEGNTDSLGSELLQTLLKMAPSKEEELKLKECKDGCAFKLDPAAILLKAVLDIPFAFKRVEAMLYIANFQSEINYLRKSFETLQTACKELRSSRIFMKLLEYVLKTGNRMNVGTNRGDAGAFNLDTLLKLVDIKGADGKTNLLHFVVQELTKAEGTRLAAPNHPISSGRNHTCTLEEDLEFKKPGLVVVAGLGGQLSNVKKAAGIHSEVLTGYVSKLSRGISKVNETIKLNGPYTAHERGRRFHGVMFQFLNKAQEEIFRVQSQEQTVLSLVKETTEYFHGNVAEEGAHPFRIFLIVRDFVSVLDEVCKEVGKANEGTMVGSALQQPPPTW